MRYLLLVSLTLSFTACSRAEPVPAKQTQAAPAQAAPAAPKPAAVQKPGGPTRRKVSPALVEQLAANAASIHAATGDNYAIDVAYANDGSDAKLTAACDDEDRFISRVLERARAAVAGKLVCGGQVCVHYGDDYAKSAFVFRPDGSFAGIIDNSGTIGDGVTDEEIAYLFEMLEQLCPKTPSEEAVEVSATLCRTQCTAAADCKAVATFDSCYDKCLDDPAGSCIASADGCNAMRACRGK
jgi:hypothetical protein